MMITTLIGLAAATCTTASYVPQLKKCWDTGRAEDLSKKMILTLGLGIALWVAYGFAQRDVVIILANGISLLLWHRRNKALLEDVWDSGSNDR
jgi:MtN3 and saliva related transmembrane protein